MSVGSVDPIPTAPLEFRIEPIDLDSTDDIDETTHIGNLAFVSQDNPFQRAYHLEPFPPVEEITKASTKRLVYGLKHGRRGWKAVLDEHGKDEDGKMVGFAIWHPPGVRIPTFESTNKDDLEPELEALYEPVDLNAWNEVFGKFQAQRDEIHKDQDHWYLDLLAVHPAYQRKGVGQLLLRHQLDQLPDGLAVQLESSPEGQGLYRKVGFEVFTTFEIKGGITIPVMLKNYNKAV